MQSLRRIVQRNGCVYVYCGQYQTKLEFGSVVDLAIVEGQVFLVDHDAPQEPLKPLGHVPCAGLPSAMCIDNGPSFRTVKDPNVDGGRQ